MPLTPPVVKKIVTGHGAMDLENFKEFFKNSGPEGALWMTFGPGCHPEAPMDARYLPEHACLEFKCHECNAIFAAVSIAPRPLEKMD